MREAIGGVSLFQIVIVFILVFTGIMCLTINHSKAFAVKNEIINIIENGEISNGELKNPQAIADYLVKVGYRTVGDCPTDAGWEGYNRLGMKASLKKASFCLRKNDVSKVYSDDAKEKCKNSKCTPTTNGFPSMVYYDIVLFYQLDVPIINSLLNFKLKGATKVIFG